MGQVDIKDFSIEQIKECLKKIRRVAFVAEDDLELRPLMNQQFLSTLVELLKLDIGTYFELINEALTCLANLVGKSTERWVLDLLFSLGIVRVLTELTEKDNNQVQLQESALFALSNLAGDEDLNVRNQILDDGSLVFSICRHLENFNNYTKEMKDTIFSLVYNLTRGTPYPIYILINPLVVPLFELLGEGGNLFADQEALLLDCLVNITGGEDTQLEEAIFTTNVVKDLSEYLTSTLHDVLLPALRLAGRILSSSEHDEQQMDLIEKIWIPKLMSHLQSPKLAIQKEIYWCLGNFLAARDRFVEFAFSSGLMRTFLNLVTNTEVDPQVRIELLRTLSNATGVANEKQILTLVEGYKLFDTLFFYATSPMATKEGLRYVLMAIENLLEVGEVVQLGMNEVEEKLGQTKQNPFVTLIERIGGIKILEDLQEHNDEALYLYVVKIIEKYFNYEVAKDSQ